MYICNAPLDLLVSISTRSYVKYIINLQGVYYIILCNTLTPQIKGNCWATSYMYPFAAGQHHALEGGIPFL